MKQLLPLIFLVAAACNDGSSSGFVATPSATLPAAVAGDDFKVLVSTTGVTLNGSKSWDPAGGVLTYFWEPPVGSGITLSSSTVASPTFDAPATTAVLTFKLTVTGAQGSDTDEVTVSVKSLIVTALDTWFVGYGKSTPTTFDATVTGGIGTLTYEWTGVERWMDVGTTADEEDLVLAGTPTIADFQAFSDTAGVAVLKKTAQGRAQLKIKVTDDMGTVAVDDDEFDEDFVNFSVGPFADSIAHENVAFGEPVFLNGGGGAVASWAWTGTKPNGAALTSTALPTSDFKKPDKSGLNGSTGERFIYFVPDQVGDYQIILTQTPGGIKVIDITCGKYIGVGNLIGTTPDPFAGECASCHGGQLSWLADFANPWLETGHASMHERILDPANAYYTDSQAKGRWLDAFNFGSNYSIDSRNVGWSTITSGTNNGWVERAGAEGYVFKGTTWSEMKRKFPKTAAMSNVQCESCHGPGSEHAGDTTGIRKSYDVSLCGRCHASKQDQWEAGPHGLPVITSPSGSASCNNCHTAQGFVVEMRAQEGADPHPVLFSGSNINRPVIPLEDRRGTTCQACHEPHKRTVGRNASGSDPQLRAFGNVKFRNDAVVDAGLAATCFMCHQSRRDPRDGSPDSNERRGPHDSTAAEMLTARNGAEFSDWTYDSSPHGVASKFVAPGKTENLQCLSCHVDVMPASGEPGHKAVGGHTFSMKQGTGASVADDVSHTGGATVAGTRKFIVSSGTFLKTVFAGDTLTLTTTVGGLDQGVYTVQSVDSGRQITLAGAGAFAGESATDWTLFSVVKYNPQACSQCHFAPSTAYEGTIDNYDGTGGLQPIQTEIDGLLTALLGAINAELTALIGAPNTLSAGSSIRYTNGTVTRTFPGPGVSASSQPDFRWNETDPIAPGYITAANKVRWTNLYKAAYNYAFVQKDNSGGIHNTGYAVNLLQSSYYKVTGTTIGAPYVPYP